MKKVLSDTRVPVKIWTTDIEQEAEAQLKNVANLPFIHKHVAVMPDAHAGKGSTVGTVIATRGAIIPAAIGVDIGCGMCAVRLPFKAEVLKNLPKLRSSIERSIPVGHRQHDTVERIPANIMDHLGDISEKTKNIINLDKAAHQLGTLGGGNHFIEVCEDTNGQAWVMLHSGSRNIGKTLAEVHINEAKELMKQAFISVPDPDLSYLWQGSKQFEDYLHDLKWAQRYAKYNRNQMMEAVLKDISFHVYGEMKSFEELITFRVDCHHNYCNMENHFGQNVWITRKGAVSARFGEYGIIPGSMGAKSFIVRGKGNADSFNSCSHGAGRRMSRTEARRRFTKEDFEAQTLGVECRKDADVIDEIPGAYKDIEEVMANQADLVEVAYQLKQILCVKG